MVDPAPAKKGREFTIVVSAGKQVEGTASGKGNPEASTKKGDDMTVNVLQLRAESSQIRVDWTDALNEILRRRNEQQSQSQQSTE